MQTAGNQRKKSQPSTEALTVAGSALFLCAKPVCDSGALKLGIAAQLGPTEPEGDEEEELRTRWVSGNSPVAVSHQSVTLVYAQFLLVVWL